jgi:hypothetical protein
MIDYEKQNEEFSKWWDDQVLDSNRWTTLERIAAQNAWIEAHKRALNLHDIAGQREQLCEGLHSTDFNGKCFKCGEQVFVREPK